MIARPDVVIAGGGPAGLATALALSRQGLDVSVIEKRRRMPIDKPCGEGLMPDGMAVLDRLGVELSPTSCHPIGGIRYLDSASSVEARFVGRGGVGIRRTRLHAALLCAVEASGIDLRLGVSVRGLRRASDGSFGLETDSGRVDARFLVAADGLRSPLRAAACLAKGNESRTQRRFGVRRHFARAPWTDHVEVHWADDCEAYVTPVAADEVGVALLWRGRSRGWDELLAQFPVLVERFAGVPARTRALGCGPLRQGVRGVIRKNLALVGDAAGYVDAITGEGLSLAFHQAEALTRAVAMGELRRYSTMHRRIVSWPDRLTSTVLGLERRPWLRRRALAALSSDPSIFARLLAVHARAAAPRTAVFPWLRLLAGIARI